MSSFDPSTHKLAGSNLSEAGGLILKGSKTKSNSEGPSKSDDDTVFKRPTAASRLGLDRLARRKREEREAEMAGAFNEKKPRLLPKAGEEGPRGDPDVRISFGRSSRSQDGAAGGRDRKYRGSLIETPTYTGGVSEEALHRIHSRLVEREQRAYTSSSSSSSSSRGRDRERRSDDKRDSRWATAAGLYGCSILLFVCLLFLGGTRETVSGTRRHRGLVEEEGKHPIPR